MDAATGQVSRASRWLLFALIFGVAAMHTLGHLTSGHGSSMSPVAGHAAVQASGGMASQAMPSAVFPVSHTPQYVTDLGGHQTEPDPSTVCLAVLTSLSLLLLAMSLIGLRRSWRPVGDGSATPLSVARPPPDRTALRLARLSVLRV